MKINFKNKNSVKELYQVGNVICDVTDTLYLVIGDDEDGYRLVNLVDNTVTHAYITLEGLANEYGDETDALVNAEINVL